MSAVVPAVVPMSEPGTGLSPSAAAIAPWIVLKFGGTSVSRRERWDTIGRLMRQRAEREGARVLVVVSALSGVTNALQAIADAHADLSTCRERLHAVVERHRGMAAELGLDADDAVLDARLASLRALCDDPRRAQGALAWQADLLAQGELLSSTLGVAYLQSQGLPVGWCDAREGLIAAVRPNQTAWSLRLSASCDYAPSLPLRERLAALPPLLVTQGFIARAADGGTAILGRGGSDTSAAYFGALLGAQRVEIWTDVPGMFSANPRLVPDARLLSRLDYEEAQEIATTGAKVLHPRCIHPCRETGVPLWIRDTGRPGLDGEAAFGTDIDATGAGADGVKAISSRRGIVLVAMESIGMWQQVGFLAEIFERFRRHGLSVDMIGSSETNVTVSLDPSENLVNSNVIDALCADLAQICRVKVIAPCAAITLVGRGMRSLLHKLTDVWSEFGRERVHLISQSSNDLNLSFVVDETLVDGLMPRLHELLIHSGAMPVDEPGVFGPSWRQLDAPAAARPPAWWHGAARPVLLTLAEAGTPRYVYDLDTVRARALALAQVATIDRRFFAIKANPHPAILRVLVEQGYGLECVSQGELEHVFGCLPGLDPGRVLFTPSFAPRSEYAAAFARGVHVTVDSAYVLEAWPALFRGREVFLRIDPGFGSGHHEKVRTGGKGAKFGLPVAGLPAFTAAARVLGTRVVGLHAHIGSGVNDAAHWRDVYAQLAALADGIGASGAGQVAAINVGGGLGVPYEPDAAPFDVAAYAAALAQVKAAYPQFALWIEPGRYLVAEAGALLLRVTQIVEKSGVRRVGADAGMNALLRPALYNAFHEIVNLSRLDEAPGPPCDVVGPICETGDVLGRRRRLPATTAEGDVLLVGNAGAYGAVMASRYNQRALPLETIHDASCGASEHVAGRVSTDQRVEHGHARVHSVEGVDATANDGAHIDG